MMHLLLHEFAKTYDTDEDIANALIAEGVQLLEKELFSEGKLLGEVVVTPDRSEHNRYVLSVYERINEEDENG